MTRSVKQAGTVALQRATNRQWVLKPQDLAVALKLVVLRGRWLSYAALAEAMHLSRYEAHAAVQRLLAAGLLDDSSGAPRPVVDALRDFVIHDAPYAYPPVHTGMSRDFASAAGAPPLRDRVAVAEPPSVWPHPDGPVRGPGLLPLYGKLPPAARDDPALYELLAQFDALRAGQGPERALARDLPEAWLSGGDSGRRDKPEEAGTMAEDMLDIGGELAVSHKALEALARKYHIRRLSLFGSAARGELRPDSDIDLLVEFEEGKAPSLWSSVTIQEDFSRLFQGQPVDLVSLAVLRNPFRRRTIERDLRVLIDEAA